MSTSKKAKKEEKDTLTEVLGQINAKTLKTLVEKLSKEKIPEKKEELITLLVDIAVQKGESEMCSRLNGKEKGMKDIASLIYAALFGKEPGKLKKDEMVSEIKKELKKAGSDEMVKKLKAKDLNEVTKRLFDFQEEGGKEAAELALLDELTMHGVSNILVTHKKDTILSIAKDLSIDTADKKKDDIIQEILKAAFPSNFAYDEEKEESTKKSTTTIKLKDIQKGISRDELTQYGVKELQAYCTKNSIRKYGTKREVIKRILDFLEGKLVDDKKDKKKKKALSAEEKEAKAEERNKEQEEWKTKVAALKRKRWEEMAKDVADAQSAAKKQKK